MSEDSTGEATAVTIFGQTYHLRGGDDGAYLADLASHVDYKMRDFEVVFQGDDLALRDLDGDVLDGDHLAVLNGYVFKTQHRSRPLPNRRR